MLTQLAASAINLNGYIIQVKGYADSSGNAVMNENLSMDRAQAGYAYLLQNCSIPLRHGGARRHGRSRSSRAQ